MGQVAQPPIQVTEYKPTSGQWQRSRMDPPPPLEVSPFWKTTDILEYKILLIGNPWGMKISESVKVESEKKFKLPIG